MAPRHSLALTRLSFLSQALLFELRSFGGLCFPLFLHSLFQDLTMDNGEWGRGTGNEERRLKRGIFGKLKPTERRCVPMGEPQSWNVFKGVRSKLILKGGNQA